MVDCNEQYLHWNNFHIFKNRKTRCSGKKNQKLFYSKMFWAWYRHQCVIVHQQFWSLIIGHFHIFTCIMEKCTIKQNKKNIFLHFWHLIIRESCWEIHKIHKFCFVSDQLTMDAKTTLCALYLYLCFNFEKFFAFL